MSEHPILFSGPMVRAILAGRKTQTRRPLRTQPVDHAEAEPGSIVFVLGELHRCHEPRGRDEAASGRLRAVPLASPIGAPGDVLYVKEAVTRSGGYVQYVADGKTSRHLWPAHWTRDPQSARFMPRRFARLRLLVKATRYERIQSISEPDARAEGVEFYVPGHGPVSEAELLAEPGFRTAGSYRDGFAFAWSGIYDKPAEFGKSWESNLWVSVASFERINGEPA